MSLSYAIMFSKDQEELTRLLLLLAGNQLANSELVLLHDTATQCDNAALWRAITLFSRYKVRHQAFSSMDFAERRNTLQRACVGEWIWMLDPDELPNKALFDGVELLLKSSLNATAYAMARENKVKDMPMGYLLDRKWTIDDKLRINWPDYQIRLYRNLPSVYWVGKVHETLCQVPVLGHLPQSAYLEHHKTFERQVEQNATYDKLDSK
jgi:hypothetical protein